MSIDSPGTATEPVLSEERDGILVITLNRPRARNAVDLALALGVSAALDRLDEDPALRAGVIAGSGPAFCAGMDLKAFARGEIPRPEPRGFAGIVKQPPKKPLIAAVDGPAMGGGFEIVLACDLVVASRNARFGLPEVSRGLTANGGGLFRLQQRIPRAVATEMILTGAPLNAEDALRLGLINRLVEPGAADAAALELAAAVAANGPLATRISKQVMTEAPDWPAHEVFDRQEEIVKHVRESQDAAEGARAFTERRKPVWTGR